MADDLLAPLLDALDTGVVIVRLERPGDGGSFRQLAANAAASRATGVDMKKDNGRTWAEFSPGLVGSAFDEMLSRTATTGEESTWDLDYGDARFERSRWKGRGVRIAENTVLVTFENVSQRDEMHAELLRFRKVFEQSPIGKLIYRWDDRDDLGSFRLIASNAAAARMSGTDISKDIGKTLNETTPAMLETPVPGRYAAAVTDGEPRRWEIEYADDRFARRYYSANCYKVDDDHVGVLFEDISERRNLELRLEHHAQELTRSNAELEQFAYVASHDLQEPLRMVASYVELLAKRYEGALDERADKYIHYAVEGATRMQVLINDLLQYSRVHRKGHPFESMPLSRAAASARENLSTAIKDAGARVHWDALPDVEGDETQLASLLQNLFSNGIKFRRVDRPPEVVLSLDGEEPAHWRLSVADNGIGIDPEQYARIFRMFQRLHERDRYPGTGIGLALCKRIVERHGGRIWVEAADGGGTRFVFTLAKNPVQEMQ